MKRLLKSRETGLFLLALVLVVIISCSNPSFLDITNLMNVLKGNLILAIVSVGMLMVMVTGGIDASVGGIIAATTLVVGNFTVQVTGNVAVAFLLGGVTGMILGTLNGLLVAYVKLPPLVATLGMYSIMSGLMIFITKGAYVNNIPAQFTDFGRVTFLKIFTNSQGDKVGLPIQFLVLVFVLVLTWIILRYTKIGRGIFSIGNNITSAERIGYNVPLIQTFVYAYMGLICGLAGVTHISIMKQVDPNAFNGYEMKVIAAVILGGVNVMGGEGSLTGTMLGVALFAIINNGLTLMKISTFWQKIILGAVMVVAICFVVVQKRRAMHHRNKVDIAMED